jgi:chemotaxis response regulator CheB/chemotaxis methyl-accepting protein methylase
MAARRQIRVLIVDDSAVMRSLLRSVVSADAGLEVAGTAADGAAALSCLETVQPDLILLDVEMPVLDGLAMLKQLRGRGHRMPVIMCSSLTQRGARVTIEALAGGASDYVAKPAGQSSREAAMLALSQELIPKIHALADAWHGQPQPLFPGAARPLISPLPVPAARSQLPPSMPSVLAFGVSTGGPVALDALLPALPANFPLPVLIVQHMPALFTQLFAERLNSRCGLRVREACENDAVRAGTIYIARGNWHLEAVPCAHAGAPATLHLSQSPQENHCRPSVDVLFRSVARVYGSGVLAVVLTGMGSDGMNGCRAIREQRGCVLAQDEATSTVWGMPGAVVRAGLAHKVLPLSAMVAPRPSPAGGAVMEPAAGTDYNYLRQLVFGLSQNVLDPARDYLFDVRLSKLLRNQGMTRMEELVRHLRARKDPALERAVAEAMTINETSFFRDRRPFELLRAQLLPKLIETRRPLRRLRFWSAACSTGQETYSLAMLLLEHFPMLAGWKLRIEGTDICLEVIERAQVGRYRRIEMNRGLPARYMLRYFDRLGEDWVVKPEVRRLCNFRHANLCAQSFPFSRAGDSFDVIFLRNVMLYFARETRRTLLANMHRLLAPDGILFLGSSEQPADPSLWTAVLAGGTCHFRPRQPS